MLIVLVAIDARHHRVMDIDGAEVVHSDAPRDDEALVTAVVPLDTAVQDLSPERADDGVVAQRERVGHLAAVVTAEALLIGAVGAGDGHALDLWHLPQCLDKRQADDVAAFPLVIDKVALQAVPALIVLDAAVVSDLVDDLGHEQVERRKGHHKAHHVECRRQLEAASHVDDILEGLTHQGKNRFTVILFRYAKMRQIDGMFG